MVKVVVHRHIPNLLTALRVAAAFVPLAVLASAQATAAGVALLVLAIAAATDFLDGKLARAWGVTSRVGQVLDSVADKLILASLLVLAIQIGLFGPVGVAIALLLLLREIWVGGLREGLGERSALLSATRAAKWKTTFQFAGLLLVFADAWAGLRLGWLAELALAPALLLSLISAWDYSRRGLAALAERDEPR
ncbi:MAG: CDP-alcohol phosphatidyltransferase family protein [Alphaproteobacteria bacterium]|nr:CDP-alcohol phosphatidyltransferase family protein [Alphaproteobacteria bacterium]MCB9929606.1 CDP-alcohol phosphatidyltransferase family protein [Alphaproteobacteria bacterium]